MKKFFFATLVATACATSAFAQENNTTDKKVGFSVGVELASPIGKFGDIHNFGIGGTAQGEYMASDEVGITLNAGYISYSGKTVNGFKYPTASQIPILAGARYYFIKDIYVSGQLGASIFKTKGFDSESAFTFAPGIGAKVSIIDGTLKYMGSTTKGSMTSNVSLRIAVTF